MHIEIPYYKSRKRFMIELYIIYSFHFFIIAECLDSNGNPISSSTFEYPGDCSRFYQVKDIISDKIYKPI